MTYNLVLFQDNLRLADNPALSAALATGDPIIPLFVLDDLSPGDWRLGAASRWWLHNSLAALNEHLERKGSRLILRRGALADAVERLFDETEIGGVYFERGYAPWSPGVEQNLKSICDNQGVCCKRFAGRLLFEPEAVRTQQGHPYTVFTPFWRACQAGPPPAQPVPEPEALLAPGSWPISIDLSELELLPQGIDWTGGLCAAWEPGEMGAEKRLTSFLGEGLAGYKDRRDSPALAHATSNLAAHLRFGEISARSIWWAVKAAVELDTSVADNGTAFLRQLAWRDFSTHLLANRPGLPERPLKEQFEAFAWTESTMPHLKKWQRGQTGFPIVDAGMRQLWQTGSMHNRVRMIAASFLIKDLLIDWREGERWFWDTLVDADIANNAASWQWVAGCGADAAPFFRIFNPVLQGEKFDSEGAYVRRYVPELAALPTTYIHKPWEAPDAILSSAGIELGADYPRPIVDRKITRQRALDAYAAIKN